MRLARLIAPLIGAIAVSASLYGCAGSPVADRAPQGVDGIALPPLARPVIAANAEPFAELFPSDRWVNTAQLYGNDAKIYRRHGVSLTFKKSLMNGLASPQGTVATRSGWWYVSNAGHSNVLIYRMSKKSPKGPSAALDDYGQVPDNVDVTEDRRLAAVSNLSTTGGGNGSLSIYLDRRAEPARTLTYGHDALQGAGVAIDYHGNCYWSANDQTTHAGSIVRFSGCAGAGQRAIAGIGVAGGLTFDRNGNLFYVDQTDGIHRCAGTRQCKLLATGFGDPVNINFDANERHLWVADASGYIDAIDPKSGALLSSIPAKGGEEPFGVAPVPGD